MPFYLIPQDVVLMNRSVVKNTLEKMTLMYRVRCFLLLDSGAGGDEAKAISLLAQATYEVGTDLKYRFSFPSYWTPEYDLRVAKILLSVGHNAFRYHMHTQDPELCLSDPSAVASAAPGVAVALGVILTEKALLARLSVVMGGVEAVLAPGYQFTHAVPSHGLAMDADRELFLQGGHVISSGSAQPQFPLPYTQLNTIKTTVAGLTLSNGSFVSTTEPTVTAPASPALTCPEKQQRMQGSITSFFSSK